MSIDREELKRLMDSASRSDDRTVRGLARMVLAMEGAASAGEEASRELEFAKKRLNEACDSFSRQMVDAKSERDSVVVELNSRIAERESYSSMLEDQAVISNQSMQVAQRKLEAEKFVTKRSLDLLKNFMPLSDYNDFVEQSQEIRNSPEVPQ